MLFCTLDCWIILRLLLKSLLLGLRDQGVQSLDLLEGRVCFVAVLNVPHVIAGLVPAFGALAVYGFVYDRLFAIGDIGRALHLEVESLDGLLVDALPHKSFLGSSVWLGEN